MKIPAGVSCTYFSHRRCFIGPVNLILSLILSFSSPLPTSLSKTKFASIRPFIGPPARPRPMQPAAAAAARQLVRFSPHRASLRKRTLFTSGRQNRRFIADTATLRKTKTRMSQLQMRCVHIILVDTIVGSNSLRSLTTLTKGANLPLHLDKLRG